MIFFKRVQSGGLSKANRAPGRIFAGFAIAVSLIFGFATPDSGFAAEPVAVPLQPAPDSFFSFLKGEYTASVGARAYFEPVFAGSKRLEIAGVPVLSLNKKGTPDTFSSPHDSPGFAIYESAFFRMGPVLGYQIPRLPKDDNALRGLRKIGFVLEPGVFAEIFPTDFTRIRAELRQGTGGHHGQHLAFAADAYTRFAERWFIAVGPRVSFASASAFKPYFDVDAAQSLNSGLPVYRNRGGIRAVGAGAVLRYTWSKQWESEIFGEYERLLGDVAKSPLVKQRGNANQFLFGVGLIYKFDFVSPFGR